MLKSIPSPGRVRPFLGGANGGSAATGAAAARPPISFPENIGSSMPPAGPVGVSNIWGSGRMIGSIGAALFFLLLNFSKSAKLPALLRMSPFIRFLDMLNGSLLEGGWLAVFTLTCDWDRAFGGGDSSSMPNGVSSFVELDNTLIISGVILKIFGIRTLTPWMGQQDLRIPLLSHIPRSQSPRNASHIKGFNFNASA